MAKLAGNRLPYLKIRLREKGELERHHVDWLIAEVEQLRTILLHIANEAYTAEVVDTEMVDLIDETRDEWIETWLDFYLEGGHMAAQETD